MSSGTLFAKRLHLIDVFFFQLLVNGAGQTVSLNIYIGG
jgi:hypothetical protein